MSKMEEDGAREMKRGIPRTLHARHCQDEEENAMGVSVSPLTATTPNQPTPMDELESSRGGTSTVSQAIFNFTNGIVGAGAIGLGGAFAQSGGLISILCLLCFGLLTKFSLDMLIELTLRTLPHGSDPSYEALGLAAFGPWGKSSVLWSKTFYSFGCLVAYIVVVRDNFGTALLHLLYPHQHPQHQTIHHSESSFFPWLLSILLHNQDLQTLLLSTFVILPLCLLRDMTALSRFSVVSVFAMVAIVLIVMALFILDPAVRLPVTTTFYQRWIQIRPGLIESLGTFVFTFVSQNVVHLAYQSLDPTVRTIRHWKRVSFYSIAIASTVSLLIGLFVYMTFWEQTKSDIFELYPQYLPAVNVAKLLLCVTMLLTFPLPFFTCREMIIVVLVDSYYRHPPLDGIMDEFSTDMQKPLLYDEMGHCDTIIEEGGAAGDETLPEEEEAKATKKKKKNFDNNVTAPSLSSNNNLNGGDGLQPPLDLTQPPLPTSAYVLPSPSWLLHNDSGGAAGTDDDDNRQLSCLYHIGLTILLWASVTILAIVAPSLGDVLNLVGCATGTVIAFILPALFWFKLVGYSSLAMIIFVIGGIVGSIGTAFSLKKLILDL